MDSKLIHAKIGNWKGLSEPILMQLMQELNAEAVKCRDRTFYNDFLMQKLKKDC